MRWSRGANSSSAMRCRCRTSTCSAPAALSVNAICNPREPRLDGLAGFFGEIARVLSRRENRLADDHANRARLFQDTAPRPKSAGIVREGHDELARGDGQECAAHAELAGPARHHARALREDDDPEAVREPRLALLEHLIDRAVTFAPVDSDGPQKLQSPAHERDPQE